MSAPQHPDDITLATWLNITVMATMAISMSAVIALALVALPLLAPSSLGTFVATAVVSTVIIISACLLVHLMLRRKITSTLLRLVDLCREYAGGDHTVRAEVLGNDAFALLAMSLNSLLDTQGIDSPTQDSTSLGSHQDSMLALQAQVERLQRLVERAIQDREEQAFSRSISVLTETFSSLIHGLAQVIGHVQDTSLQMMTIIHTVDNGWRTQAQEMFAQTTLLAARREATGAQVDFLQRSLQQIQHAQDIAETLEQQAITSKQTFYQSLEALYSTMEQMGQTSERVSTLEQIATEMLQVVEELGTLGGHLSLLSAKGSPGQHIQTGSVHPVVEADLSHLARMAAMLTPRLVALTVHLHQEAQSATEAISSSANAVKQSTTCASEIGRVLTEMVFDASQHHHDLTILSTTIQDEIPQVQAQVQVFDLLLGRMHQTQQVMTDLHDRLLTLVAISEQLRGDISEQLHASGVVARAPDLLIRTDERDQDTPVTALTKQITG